MNATRLAHRPRIMLLQPLCLGLTASENHMNARLLYPAYTHSLMGNCGESRLWRERMTFHHPASTQGVLGKIFGQSQGCVNHKCETRPQKSLCSADGVVLFPACKNSGSFVTAEEYKNLCEG